MREMGAICQIGVFTFSHYVFNDCGPNRGFYSDFSLSPSNTVKITILSSKCWLLVKK